MINKLKQTLLFALLILLATCLRSEQKVMEGNSSLPTSKKPNKIEVSVSPVLNDIKVKSFILDYLEKNNCRLPEARDFAFSEKALADIKYIVGNYWIQIIAYDNFDSAPPINDFALMLINKGSLAPNSFRLVFFLEKEGGYKESILFDNANLSTSTMFKQRRGWYLSTFSQEGSKKNCYFMWDSTEKTIKCNEE